MNKTLLILLHEIKTTLFRPSYLFALFGVPIIGAIIFTVAGQLNKGGSAQSVLSQLISSPQSVKAEGYVDTGGIIKDVPDSVPAGMLLAFPTEAAARQALDTGQVAAYYVIPADYVLSGEITCIRTDVNPPGAPSQEGLLEWVLNVNLLGGDAQKASLVNGPSQVQKVPLSAAPQRDQNSMLTYFLPYGATMVFYFIILSTATLMLNSVTREKENRLMEVLMVSVTPRQLLIGKIVALGLVGLLQTIVWVSAGRILLARGSTVFNLSAAFQLPASFLAWGVLFFLLGYAVYASLMAGLGALVPNLREASQSTIIVVFPLIIPLFLINVLIEQPHSPVSTILSIFPLTAPVSMMTRLASGGVPLWQILLSAALLALTAMFVVRAVARMFRAQSILSGQLFSRKLFFNTLFGRA